MRLAFDHQAFCRRPYTGISRYYLKLLEHLPLAASDQVRLFAPLHVNALLAEANLQGFEGQYFASHPRLLRPVIRAASGWLTRHALSRFAPDLVHETYYSAHSVAPPRVPLVLTVYDLIHERFPRQFAWQQQLLSAKRRAIARAEQTICISSATQRDLQALYDLPAQRVNVVPLGIDPAPNAATLAHLNNNPPLSTRPFVLFVGERGSYKNFARLLTAYAQSSRLRSACDLICFGGDAWTQAERQQLADQRLHNQVRQLGGRDQRLHWFYRHALALVYPSLYEGFGLPLLEAMRWGCPVASSDRSALPEVAAHAASYFDPESVEAIQTTLETLVFSESERARLRALGLERIQQFSWTRCAENTLAIYRHLVS